MSQLWTHLCSVNMNGNKFTLDEPPWGPFFFPPMFTEHTWEFTSTAFSCVFITCRVLFTSCYHRFVFYELCRKNIFCYFVVCWVSVMTILPTITLHESYRRSDDHGVDFIYRRSDDHSDCFFAESYRRSDDHDFGFLAKSYRRSDDQNTDFLAKVTDDPTITVSNFVKNYGHN